MTQNCALPRQLPLDTFFNAVAVITDFIKRKVTKMGYLLYTCNGIMTIPVFEKNYQMIHTLILGETRNYLRTAGHPTGLQYFLQEGRQAKNVVEMRVMSVLILP
jgi:hypothetical protein